MNNLKISIMVISAITLGVISCTNKKQDNDSAVQSDSVRKIVVNFGETLKKVSLLSPAFKKQMRQHYAAYVTEELLSKWMAHPKRAPGRLTSSPWPERIDIAEVKRINAQQYIVNGQIILLTSVEKTSEADDRAGSKPIKLAVEKIGGELADFQSID